MSRTSSKFGNKIDVLAIKSKEISVAQPHNLRQFPCTAPPFYFRREPEFQDIKKRSEGCDWTGSGIRDGCLGCPWRRKGKGWRCVTCTYSFRCWPPGAALRCRCRPAPRSASWLCAPSPSRRRPPTGRTAPPPAETCCCGGRPPSGARAGRRRCLQPWRSRRVDSETEE
ncbi:hypothetical protein MPH_05342 [Macrophomina phaseolina MS6]|uniref:Uncharacterized protein n=1 Tax=Macrophomina phaseolina (strain MS6) TaxID=1126212 RepID=K2R4U1_MACPH|nr:hypothetical protein MPH_05342 [Macrophomina phaseolina MS6]